MARLLWDQPGARVYENGVSQGVFYTSDGTGVAWNGLTSVDNSDNTDTEALYFDGFKYADVVTLSDFSGKLKAFTYPDEFLEYEGVATVTNGLRLTDQPKKRFGLSYRTEISSDQGQSIGYKIHLLYNLLAIPSEKTYETLSMDAEPADFEWDISAIPEMLDRYRPTAHIIFDSTKLDPFLLSDVENIIYGDAEDDARLPDLASFVRFVQKWGRFVVTDNGDGTWTATSPLEGVITMLDETTFQITADEATFLDADTYQLTSSAVDEGILWPP